MGFFSQAELDVKAKAAVFSLDRNLEQAGIIKQICQRYLEFCDSPEANKLSIKSRKITEGSELRMLFEALCFTSFLTYQIIPRYVSSRGLIRKKINHELVGCYRKQVAKHLFRLCEDFGMTKLQDVVLISPPPNVKIKFGDFLNPLVRLKEYLEYRARKRGSEIERFAEHIGKALDPYHYRELAKLSRPQALNLTKLAERVMNEVFKRSV